MSSPQPQPREWRDVVGHEGRYQVSSDGYVRSLPDVDRRGRFMSGRILSVKLSEKGYELCTLDRKQVRVHRVVGEAFVPNPDEKPQINHKDGNKRNNQWRNLEWATNSENQLHRHQVLMQPGGMQGKTGAACKNSKPVRCIHLVTREVREYPGASEAARQLDLHGSAIARAAHGQIGQHGGWTWEWVNP